MLPKEGVWSFLLAIPKKGQKEGEAVRTKERRRKGGNVSLYQRSKGRKKWDKSQKGVRRREDKGK